MSRPGEAPAACQGVSNLTRRERGEKGGGLHLLPVPPDREHVRSLVFCLGSHWAGRAAGLFDDVFAGALHACQNRLLLRLPNTVFLECASEMSQTGVELRLGDCHAPVSVL